MRVEEYLCSFICSTSSINRFGSQSETNSQKHNHPVPSEDTVRHESKQADTHRSYVHGDIWDILDVNSLMGPSSPERKATYLLLLPETADMLCLN